jgi:NAD(P)-dependent dehydrogenase (short-subunit alcohol dehydrogenase family)
MMSNEVFFDKSCLGTLKGKVVVFTGGASGIGREAVTIFSKAGAQIVFGDIDKVNGEELASELGRCVCVCTWLLSIPTC